MRRFGPHILAIVSVNAAFVWWLEQSVVRQHLRITVQGPRVAAVLAANPPAQWDDAPGGSGRLGIAIRRRESLNRSAGIEDIRITAIQGGGILLDAPFGTEPSAAWNFPQTWHLDRSGRSVSDGDSILWVPTSTCDDCQIDLDLINVRGFDVLLRSADARNGLLLRRQDETLAWHSQTDGQVSAGRGVVRVTPSEAEKSQHAVLAVASELLPAYVDGWRFLWWYLRAALPGMLLMVVLASWRFLGPRTPRWGAGRAASWIRAHPKIDVSILLTLAIATALMALPRPWNSGVVFLSLASVSGVATIALLAVLACREIHRMQARNPERLRHLRTVLLTAAVVAVCASATGYSAYIAGVQLEGIPHVQDSVSYLLAAKAIAHGELKVPVDPELGPFFEIGQFFEHHNGYLYPLVPGLYFAGHPALLALGCLIKTPWLVNPILSGITLGLLFLLCRALYGTSTGLLALAIGALSPFARFQSASMMTHTSALLFVTATLLFHVYWLKRRRGRDALAMGLALGALLNVRPYEAAVLGVFVAIVSLVAGRSRGWRSLVRGAGLVAAGLVPFVLLLLWQTQVVGAAARPEAHQLFRWIPENIDATRLRLENFNEDFLGWTQLRDLPTWLTVGLLLMAILVMPKTPADWFVVGWALLYVMAYITYSWHGNMFGPRYWYPSLGGQIILVARLLQRIPELTTRAVQFLWPPGRTQRWRWVSVSVGIVPMVVVAGPLFLRILVESYPRHYSRAGYGYNGFSATPLRLLAQHRVSKGLVFFGEVLHWQDLMTGLAANEPGFNTDLVFARHIEGKDQLLMNARPDHPPYAITWNGSGLELGRIVLEPGTSEVRYEPFTSGSDDPLVLGSNAFVRLIFRDGAPWSGGLTAADDGSIYAVDAVGRQILILSPDGILRRRVRVSYGFGSASFRSGHGIAVDRDKNMYVVDLDPPGLLRFNADGTFAWRARNAPDGQQRLTSPIGVAMLSDGNLVVTNSNPPGLHLIRPDGTFAGLFGIPERRTTMLNPLGVAAGPDGGLFVTEGGSKDLVRLGPDGAEIQRWKLPLGEIHPFQVPYVAVDRRGDAYVVDHSKWAVYHVRSGKREVDVIGASGSLAFPSGILARDDEVLVINSRDGKIVRLEKEYYAGESDARPAD